MNLHRHWLPLIFIILVMVLVACGDSLGEDDAEDALRAAFEGNTQDANATFCAEDQLHEVSQITQDVVFKEVTCEQKGDIHMECLSTFTTANNEDRQVKIIFRIKDDLLCDPSVQ